MNVAITRAKELLVVIGNANLLQQDPYWKGFLHFTLRHQLYANKTVTEISLLTLFHRYIGPHLAIESDGAYVSRLE
jgi:hypothetical protein